MTSETATILSITVTCTVVFIMWPNPLARFVCGVVLMIAAFTYLST